MYSDVQYGIESDSLGNRAHDDKILRCPMNRALVPLAGAVAESCRLQERIDKMMTNSAGSTGVIMAFCTNCGTKAIGDFCTNCGNATTSPQANRVNEPKPPLQEMPISKTRFSNNFKNTTQVTTPVDVSSNNQRFAFQLSNANRKPIFFGLVGLIIVAILALFPAGGSYKVVFANETSSNRPSGFSLTTSEGSRSFPGSSSPGQVLQKGVWSPLQPISVLYTPNPIKDEVVEFNVPFFANLGIWNLGRDLTVIVELDDMSSTLRLSDQAIPILDFAARGYRSNYAADLQVCENAFDGNYGAQIGVISKSYENYLRFVKEESLDGIRTLYYTIWASRSDKLQTRISNYINLTNPYFADLELSNSGSDVVSELNALRAAWGNLESVSRQEADSRWDAAWDRIYSAEGGLSSSVASFVSAVQKAKDVSCARQLER